MEEWESREFFEIVTFMWKAKQMIAELDEVVDVYLVKEDKTPGKAKELCKELQKRLLDQAAYYDFIQKNYKDKYTYEMGKEQRKFNFGIQVHNLNK